MQTGERSADVSARPRPEELRGRSGARPNGVIEVRRAGLLCPKEVLAPKDKLRLVSGQVRDGIEGVRELPALEGIAPAVPGGEVADPGTMPAVLDNGIC